MARPPSPRPPSGASLADRLGLPLVLLAALGLRLWLAAGTSGLTMDSPLYVRMAEALLARRPEPAPAHHGYPLLSALGMLVAPGRELPGRAVSLLASLALVALVWWVARRRLSAPLALLPAALVALHPLLAVYGVAIMTESSFLALAFAATALLEAGRPLAGGALFGAAWWVRPEAVVLAPLAALLAPIRHRERALALALAVCVGLPHSFVLGWAEGRWTLTPKTVLVHAPQDEARESEWRLADPTAFADSVGLAARLARDGPAIARAYPTRLAAHARRALEAWPWALLVASVVGLVLLGRPAAWLAFLALPLTYPWLAAPADLRFAQLLVPTLALAAGVGAERARERDVRALLLALALVAVGVVTLWTGPAGRLAHAFDDGPIASLRGAGAWLAANTPADAVVMDRKSYVPFFAKRRHVQLPDEALDVVLAHARASGATHLVVEEYVVAGLRPQLAPLLDRDALRHERRVRLVFATRPAPGEGVAVFEVAR